MNAFAIRFAEARKGITGSQFFVELIYNEIYL